MTPSAHIISRRRFLMTTGVAAAGATLLSRAPAALGQQARELNVWHTEVEPQTVKTSQDTSIAEFERKFPGFKIRQQPLGWGDLNTKLLAALAAGGPPDLTHLNPFMTASLYVKNLLRPMDELIRALGENDIHEATLKLQYFDGKYYGVTHAMGATYFCERRDLREKKGIKPPETFDDVLKLCAALTEGGRYALQVPGEKLYMGFVHPAEWLASNGGTWVDAQTWRPQPTFKSMLNDPAYLAHDRIKKWKPWHDVMLTALKEKRLLPLGFTRPDDNLLPFLAELDGSSIVADMVVEVMVGQKPPKAEADRAQKRAEELLTQLGHKRWS